MTTNYTTFLNLLVQAFPDYVTDIDTSVFAAQLDTQAYYNIQQIVDVQEVSLNSGATYTIVLPNLSTGWYLVMVTCVGAELVTTPTTIVGSPIAGQGYITFTETNAASTAITGILPMYGATMPSGVTFPGMGILSTQNMTANPVLTSQADGSLFQIFIATCVEDGG